MNPVSEPALSLGGGLRLRPQEPGDDAFLLRLFAESHGAALLLAPLDPVARRTLVERQAALHEAALDESAPEAHRWIVERKGGPSGGRDPAAVGRLVVGERADCLYLADIALLAESRGQGLGSRLVDWLQERARRDGRSLALKARRDGPALALYRRCGFEVVGDDGGLLLDLRWTPDRACP